MQSGVALAISHVDLPAVPECQFDDALIAVLCAHNEQGVAEFVLAVRVHAHLQHFLQLLEPAVPGQREDVHRRHVQGQIRRLVQQLRVALQLKLLLLEICYR